MDRNSINPPFGIGLSGFGKDGKKEFVVKKLCQHLRGTLTVEEWKKYEGQKTDMDRLEPFLNLKTIQSCVQKHLKLHPGVKNISKAMDLKNKGNKAFGSGDNESAVCFYTKALAWVPHDTKDVGILYANRSAALFHLEDYFYAKQDAELAFNLNYPKELHYKLRERLGRCCLHLNRDDEANKNFQFAIKDLENAELDAQKATKIRKNLAELIKSPSAFTHGFNQTDGANVKSQQLPSVPEIVGGCGKYLKVASSRVNLEYRDNRGRFVIANESFRPGDVILVEKAFVSVLYPELYHRQCFSCYVPLRAPIVCENCIYASYCSTACKEKGRIHHKYECSILGLLKHSGISVICYMAVRILTQADPKAVLRSWYDLAIQTEEEELSRNLENCSLEQQINYGNGTKANKRAFGFNEEYPSDHEAVFHLVTHSKQRNPNDFFHQITMALFLLEALKTTSYFDELQTKPQVDPVDGDGLSNQDDFLQTSISQKDHVVAIIPKFALLILRFLKALHFNTHETFAFNELCPEESSVGVGGALFPTLALFNHSCNPSVVRYFVNDTVVVRAIRTILPGEVVSENYGANYSTMSKEDRQACLKSHYWFTCDCIACKENWPTFADMANDTMKFRCGNCYAFVCKSDETMGILFNCGKCRKPVNILKSLKSLQESDARYKQAVSLIDSGDMRTGLGILLENLFLLETLLVPPTREMHIMQEYIRRCYLSTGNRVSQTPVWNPEEVL